MRIMNLLAAFALVSCTHEVISTCPRCSGQRVIIGAQQVQLPAEVTLCELDQTGFLGMGPGRRVHLRVRNDGDQVGDFSVSVMGRYPGGGTVTHATQQLRISSHADGDTVVSFEAQDGMQGVTCSTHPPTVAGQTTVPCPVCGGTGEIHSTRGAFE